MHDADDLNVLALDKIERHMTAAAHLAISPRARDVLRKAQGEFAQSPDVGAQLVGVFLGLILPPTVRGSRQRCSADHGWPQRDSEAISLPAEFLGEPLIEVEGRIDRARQSFFQGSVESFPLGILRNEPPHRFPHDLAGRAELSAFDLAPGEIGKGFAECDGGGFRWHGFAIANIGNCCNAVQAQLPPV